MLYTPGKDPPQGWYTTDAYTDEFMDELDAMGDGARATLLEHRPDLTEKLEGFPGYAVIAMDNLITLA